MGKDQSDGCQRDHTVHHKMTRPIVEPTNSGCKELVDNEMKQETHFTETASTNVLANCDNHVQEHQLLVNLEILDEIPDTRSGESLDNVFAHTAMNRTHTTTTMVPLH